VSSDSLKIIEKALQERRSLFDTFEKEKTDCFRLFNGLGEGISGFIVERYGSVLVFQWHEGKCSLKIEDLKKIAEHYGKRLGITSVYLKRFVSDRTSQNADLSYYEHKPFWGQESPSTLVCHEKGMKLEIRPYEGFSTGIFLDQRNNREFLSQRFSGHQILNCFAYTCGFSLACALTQNTVTSVDLSKKYLEWGKKNFLLNGLSPEEYLFYASDVFDHFKKVQKLGKSYDLIILDPPSFSRNQKGKVFSVKKDLEILVSQSYELLNRSGTLFVSSNLAVWTSDQVKRICQSVAAENGLKVEWQKLPEEPKDFRGAESSLAACCLRKKD
jgi:23S rRNA (cytosine1962-C5)-methyltransferase